MCGSLGLAYLAAAVSDFYVPEGCRSTHKIQSRDYGIELSPSSLPSSLSAAAAAAAAASAETGGSDDLESATIEYVMTHHFFHISTYASAGGDASSSTDQVRASAAEIAARRTLEARALHEDRLDGDRRRLRWEMLTTRASELAWNVAGSALGMALSYGIARMLQGRHQRGVA